MAGKGLLAALLAGGAAAYVAYQNLSEEKQKELAEKAKEVGGNLKDLGQVTAEAGKEAGANISEKVQEKYEELDKKIQETEYADKYNDLKENVTKVAGQAGDAFDNVKEESGKWFDKAKDGIDDLRQRFEKENIQLVEDEDLAKGLKELKKAEEDED